MTIKEMLATGKPTLSCELFPPKEWSKLEDAKEIVRETAKLSPAYISVTYGAAGTTSDFSLEMAREVLRSGVTPLAHITCVTASRSKIASVLDGYAEAGIENVLALRGDIPAGMEFPSDAQFRHADELVREIKKRGGFTLGAACYPEGHPEAASRAADLDCLKRKVDAGVDFLTTQMFFDNNILYNFLYRALQQGIRTPIIAGVMPVVSAGQIKRICALSGTTLPQKFLAIVDRFASDPVSMRQAGVAYCAGQIIDLLANGVGHIHIYAMNRPDVLADIMRQLSGMFGE